MYNSKIFKTIFNFEFLFLEGNILFLTSTHTRFVH
jgi:hypothetical protein